MSPLIQKVIKVGDSRAVTLPKSWLTFHEKRSGQKLREVTVEINDSIVIKPILKRQ